jgi:hypothetical protein
MRIYEVINKITSPTRRDFMRGAGSLAAGGLKLIPKLGQAKNLIEQIKNLNFSGNAFNKILTLLSNVSEGENYFKMLKVAYEGDLDLEYRESNRPNTSLFLKPEEFKLLNNILQEKIGHTYENLQRAHDEYDNMEWNRRDLTAEDIKKVFGKDIKITGTFSKYSDNRIDIDFGEPSSLEDYIDILQNNPARTLHMLGKDTVAYELELIAKTLAEKGIRRDIWNDLDVTNKLFPIDKIPDTRIKFFRSWYRGTPEFDIADPIRNKNNILYRDLVKKNHELITFLKQTPQTITPPRKDQIEQLIANTEKISKEFLKATHEPKNYSKYFEELRNQTKILTNTISNLSIEFEEAKLNIEKDKDTELKNREAKKVALGVRKDVGLDLMERHKKQRS